jgi:hypothetical protein
MKKVSINVETDVRGAGAPDLTIKVGSYVVGVVGLVVPFQQ